MDVESGKETGCENIISKLDKKLTLWVWDTWNVLCGDFETYEVFDMYFKEEKDWSSLVRKYAFPMLPNFSFWQRIFSLLQFAF